MPSLAFSQIFADLLRHCEPYRFPAAWGFLQEPAEIYGHVADPDGALSALRARHPDRLLLQSGVAQRQPDGTGRLAADLCSARSAVVALRAGPDQPVFALLTPRRCLPRRHCALAAQLNDHETVRRLARQQVLFGAWSIFELALLRALDVPAVLGVGLRHLPLYRLRQLDRTFAAADFDDGTVPPPRPTLALMAHRLAARVALPRRRLGRVCAHLVQARRFLGLPLAGVQVWDPPPAVVNHLEFRRTLRDRGLLREFFLQSADHLHEIEPYADSTNVAVPDPVSVVQAEVNLRRQLSLDGMQASIPAEMEAAGACYRRAVDRDLVAPLQRWALAHQDEVVRNAGIELASAFSLLHEMRPRVHALLEECLRDPAGAARLPLLREYLALGRRAGDLVRDLRIWRKWL